MSKEMEIAIQIAGKVDSSFKSAIGAATKGIGAMGKGFGKIAGIAARASMASAAAVGGLGVAAVNVGKEFETAMSQVKATMLLDTGTAEGAAAFETLENAARECGRETAYSATEAAEALNYLALAGYDAEKASAALPTVLNLAGAGAMELADASDMVTDAMSALGKEATQTNLEDFADKMAQTASKSNTSVAQLGEAILKIGGTAQGLAGDTTELNASLGILADSGIKASEGGTHLRNMIMSLQNARNSDAADMFKSLGLDAYDAEGNMRSLGDTFGDLNARLAGASAEDVNRTLSTIFKQTDLAAARAMMAATADSAQGLATTMDAALADSGTSIAGLGIDLQAMADNFDTTATQEEFAAKMLDQFGMTSEQAGILFTGLQSIVGGTGNRFEELSGQIEDSAGACEAMYKIQQDNLGGDISQLQSALSDLGISFYKDTGGALREMTQLGTDMVNQLNSAYSEGGLSGMVGEVGNCLSQIVDVAAEYAPKLVETGIDLLDSLISGVLQNSGGIASASAEVLTVFADGLFSLVPQIIYAGSDIFAKFAQSLAARLPQLINSGTQAITNFVNGLMQRAPGVISAALALVKTLVNSILANAPQLLSAAAQLAAGLAAGIAQAAPQIISAALALVQALANGIMQNAPALMAAGVQLLGSLATGIIQALPQLLQMGVQLGLSLVQGIISNIPLFLQTAVQVVTGLVTAIGQMKSMVIEGGIQLIISLAQGIISNLGNIAQAAVQIVLSLLSGMIQATPQLIVGAVKLVGYLMATLVNTDWLQVGIDILVGIKDGILSAAANFGSSVKAAVLGLFGFGGGDGGATSSAEQSGQAVATDYANGIQSNAPTANQAASALSEGVFSNTDTSGAATAGASAGAAFTAGLGTGLSAPAANTSSVLNTASVTAEMASAGRESAAAFTGGFGTGIAGTGIDTNKILDRSVARAGMASAGRESAAAFTGGFGTGIAGTGIDTNKILDRSVARAEMASAGRESTAAFKAGFNTGFAGTSISAGNVIDTAAIGASMTGAGTKSAADFTTGLNTGMSSAVVNTSALKVDTAAFIETMTQAGRKGAKAVATGIASNSSVVTSAVDRLGVQINAGFSRAWAKAESNARSAMNSISSTVVGSAQRIASQVKAAFENMTITIPKPRIPNIGVSSTSVSYGDKKGGGKVSVPKFSVSWNALGGIFSRPTIFNTPYGAQGVGEAGAEAVLPLDTLWERMEGIVGQSVRENGGDSVVKSLLVDLESVHSGSKGQQKTQPEEPATFVYSPTQNFYGGAAKQDIVDAGRLSQEDFNKMANKFWKDVKRRGFAY